MHENAFGWMLKLLPMEGDVTVRMRSLWTVSRQRTSGKGGGQGCTKGRRERGGIIPHYDPPIPLSATGDTVIGLQSAA